MTVIIDDYEGLNRNTIFDAAEMYLGTIMSSNVKNLRASLLEKDKEITFSILKDEEIVDKYSGFEVQWTMSTKPATSRRQVPRQNGYGFSSTTTEANYLVLRFHKKHKNKVFNDYLPYILERSKVIAQEKKTLKLHTRGDRNRTTDPWQNVNLDHPANFQTLAMDDETKNMIINDLDRFLERKDFYRKVGKVWKRGYLLFGPPGTGKSSLIAAMANKLNFDVYDLELSNIRSNSDLRRLLISTGNRSILVVEDIDASIDLSNRSTTVANVPLSYPNGQTQAPKVTLSGLLNFIDGLWSSCGDGRIIVFTTNHIEKLDPALLRPGRMDVHINMSYCTPSGFKLLLNNYLGSSEHPLAKDAENLIASAKVIPAEIAEQLLKNDVPEVALEGLIKFLEQKHESERKIVNSEVPDIKNSESVVKSLGDVIQQLVKLAKEHPVGFKEILLSNNDIPERDLEILTGFLGGVVGDPNVKAFKALEQIKDE